MRIPNRIAPGFRVGGQVLDAPAYAIGRRWSDYAILRILYVYGELPEQRKSELEYLAKRLGAVCTSP